MIPVLIGLGALIGGVALVASWDKIVKWLSDFVSRLKKNWEKLKIDIPHGARIFGDLIIEGLDHLCKIMHKLYYQENGQWIEETTTRKVDESKVPAAIRRKCKRNQEMDITEAMELETGLTV